MGWSATAICTDSCGGISRSGRRSAIACGTSSSPQAKPGAFCAGSPSPRQGAPRGRSRTLTTAARGAGGGGGGGVGGGAVQSTPGRVALSGFAPVLATYSVQVNGETAEYDPAQGQWRYQAASNTG